MGTIVAGVGFEQGMNVVFNTMNRGRRYEEIDFSKWESLYVDEDDNDDE